ncbi:hypothetical protein [uncultured Winogradskyella sp.]|uniref:hypothetical protein n=1 Tax=uncultured Winogradskyella sp. TaxID=395353 RepID=UPI00260E0938|nr:hypothetical protein [uncultured Winogradskyella sp.]
MSKLSTKFNKSIKEEHNDLYKLLKRENKLFLLKNKILLRTKWYHYFLLHLTLGVLAVMFSFNFNEISLLKYLNFIEIDKNYADKILHEYTLYIGTFISVTLIVTTFLFNFLKEFIDSNIKLVVRYVNYEIVAYYGFGLVVSLIVQKLLSVTLPFEKLQNLLILDFYLILIFLFLLVSLYVRIFEIIQPSKLKEVYLEDTKRICALNIFHQLFEIKSKKIMQDSFKEIKFQEISNATHFFADDTREDLHYIYNQDENKGKYLKDIHLKKLFKKTKGFQIKQFVPLHLGQYFIPGSDYLLLAFEKENEKFKDNKFFKSLGISISKIRENFILKEYKFSKKTLEKTHAQDELDEKLEFISDDFNDSIYKRNHKGVKKTLSDLEVIIDLYTQNFE